jgi:uncharacterized membrane protein
MKIYRILVFLLAMIALSSYAMAVNLDITAVEINGRKVNVADGHTINYKYERGERLDIDVCVEALAEVRDAQVEADIFGYRHSARDREHPVSDVSDTFDLDEGDNDCVDLRLVIPEMIDMDYYKLRITAADRDGIAVDRVYELHLKGVSASDAVIIKDYTFDPESIVAGRAFTANVRVRNIDDNDLDDLKVTVSVPELNIKTSEYMDNLDADETKTFEELLLRIPDCTRPGTYDVEMTVEFDEYEETSETGQITVKAGDTCGVDSGSGSGSGTSTQPDKSVIKVPTAQEASPGSSIVYPIMISNTAGVSKTYTLTVSGASGWSTTKIDPNAIVVVPAGQSKTAYLYVSVDNKAQPGDKILTLTIDTGSESKQVSMLTKVTGKTASSSAGSAADWSSFKRWLEIGLVILVVILLIIGLVIGFNKMKDSKEEPESYY